MSAPISDAIARCTICGEPMPAGEEMFNFHGYSGPCPKPPLPKPAPPEDPREARIRALEAEIARKDAALRQAIDILQVQGFPLMADFCRAALGSAQWVPTHQHVNGQFVREIKRNNEWVVWEAQGSFLPEWSSAEFYDRNFRPLTPDEARAAMENQA